MEECKKILSRIECNKEMMNDYEVFVQGYFTPALKKFRRQVRWEVTLWLTCPQDFLLLLCSSFLWVPRNSLWAPYSRYPLTLIVVTSYEMQSCWYDSNMTTYIWLLIRIWTKTYSNSSLQDTDNWPVFQACALQSWKLPDNIFCCSLISTKWASSYQLTRPPQQLWNTKSLPDNRPSSEVNFLA